MGPCSRSAVNRYIGSRRRLSRASVDRLLALTCINRSCHAMEGWHGGDHSLLKLARSSIHSSVLCMSSLAEASAFKLVAMDDKSRPRLGLPLFLTAETHDSMYSVGDVLYS